MRKIIIDTDVLLAEDQRLIKRLWKVEKDENFPEGLEFSYQFLFLKEGIWLQIARIDNQMHEGIHGTHIHVLGRKLSGKN